MSEENKPIDLSTLKVAELDEQIALYAAAEVVPAEGVELKLKNDKIAWLEEQRTAHGIPHVVTQEDVDNNGGDLPADVEAGSVVLLPLPTDPGELVAFTVAPGKMITTEDGVEHTEGKTVMLNPEDARTQVFLSEELILVGSQNDPAPEPATEPTPTPEPAPASSSNTTSGPLPERRLYQGKIITRQNDKIVNGKAYIEIHTDVESFLLTSEQYDQQVLIARSND